LALFNRVEHKLDLGTMLRLVLVAAIAGLINGECPHMRTGLKRWSDDSTWGSVGKVYC